MSEAIAFGTTRPASGLLSRFGRLLPGIALLFGELVSLGHAHESLPAGDAETSRDLRGAS